MNDQNQEVKLRMDIGDRIRVQRKLKHLTQEELSEKIGISAVHLSRIEGGYHNITLAIAVRIAEVLGISVEYLAYGESIHIDEKILNNIMMIRN